MDGTADTLLVYEIMITFRGGPMDALVIDDPLVQLFPERFGALFGILESLEHDPLLQCDESHIDRSCERSSACFIDIDRQLLHRISDSVSADEINKKNLCEQRHDCLAIPYFLGFFLFSCLISSSASCSSTYLIKSSV